MNPIPWVFAVIAAVALCPCCSTEAGAGEAPAQSVAALSSSTLIIEGITCTSCSVAVRTALKKLDGARDARVSVEEKRAVVEYDPAKVTPQQLVDAVNRLGYRARLAAKA